MILGFFLALFLAQSAIAAASEVSLDSPIPVIDLAPLLHAAQTHDIRTDFDGFCASIEHVSKEIDAAAHSVGFFYVANHNVSRALQEAVESAARRFFSLSLEEKQAIAMARGGKAWRGFFPVGDEVTSGVPDQKEGLYFGSEGLESDPRPLHGRNQWPADALGLEMKASVLAYMQEMKRLGQLLMNSFACSLQVRDAYFLDQFDRPTELFRIFNYPPHDERRFSAASMGVGEHTDYGYLTILRQDAVGGLQVCSLHSPEEWLAAPPIENTFVINLGDALEHNTEGLYRATPHRVLQRVGATSGRISMPYFFDPSFDAPMRAMPSQRVLSHAAHKAETESAVQSRWDKMDPTLFQGTYGEYLLKKVSRAFPELFQQFVEVLSSGETLQQNQ